MVEDMRATSGYAAYLLPLRKGFAGQGDDELVRMSRRDPFARNRIVADLPHGRSLSCRGFAGRDTGVADVGWSSRWPYPVHFDHISAAGTCPHFSSIASSGYSTWDAQSVKGAFARCTYVGPCCTCHHKQNFFHQPENHRLHLRENSHSGAIIKQPHDLHSRSDLSCPANYRRIRPPSSNSKQKRAAAAAAAALHPLPPFPSAHGAPYVLCQHCALLLHVPPPGTLPLSRSPPLITIKCASCLKLSTFSTRHRYAAPSSAAAGVSPAPSLSVKELSELAPMPGYGASHRGMQEAAISAESLSCGIPEFASQSNNATALKIRVEYDIDRQNSKALLHPNDVCKHGPAKCLDSDYGHISQDKDTLTGDSVSGTCAHPLEEDRIAEARECSNQSQDKDIGDSVNGVYVLTPEEGHNKGREGGTAAVVKSEGLHEDSHSDREQEITIMSSVQSWVDSLSPDTGYESDPSLHCSEKCAVGCEKHGRPLHRSPLHQHFGYKSPLELFEKVIFSEDEEMRTRTETNSTASSSSSPNNTCQDTHVRITCMQMHPVNPNGNSPNSEERDGDQRSLSKLLKRGFTKGNHSPVSLKGKVVVNGCVLSSTAVKQAEERAGKLRPGCYWYDFKAGFWGVEGGPCLGILPPFIGELNYPMAGNCSNGDTQVYVNGRELHSKDLAILLRRGLPEKSARAYSLGFDGILVDETTGLEVKHLGKLAPTVEQKGRGFGMFAGDATQVKKSVA